MLIFAISWNTAQILRHTYVFCQKKKPNTIKKKGSKIYNTDDNTRQRKMSISFCVICDVFMHTCFYGVLLVGTKFFSRYYHWMCIGTIRYTRWSYFFFFFAFLLLHCNTEHNICNIVVFLTIIFVICLCFRIWTAFIWFS